MKPVLDNLTKEQIQMIASAICKQEPGFEGAETYPECGECIVCLCRVKITALTGESK